MQNMLGLAFVLIGLGITDAVLGYVLALAVAGLTGATILFTRHTRSSNRATDSASTGLRSLLGYGLALYVATILSIFLAHYQNAA
jgi:O-antigen/teichoic acid export membrane protein